MKKIRPEPRQFSYDASNPAAQTFNFFGFHFTSLMLRFVPDLNGNNAGTINVFLRGITSEPFDSLTPGDMHVLPIPDSDYLTLIASVGAQGIVKVMVSGGEPVDVGAYKV